MLFTFSKGSRSFNFKGEPMKIMDKVAGFLAVILIAFTVSCIPQESANDNYEDDSGTSVEVNNSSIDLASYMRRFPGVFVQGSGSNAKVFVRGAQSVNSNNEPLFIVDGTRVGRSFARVDDYVSINDIDTVEVLKGNEASARYGLEGSFGVIIIHTKNN